MSNKIKKEILDDYFQDLWKYVSENFEDERRDKIKVLFHDFKNNIYKSPASSRVYYHSCYHGGWLIHTLNVIDNALKLSKLWKQEGVKSKWSKSEIIFAAMFHDLGKLGDENGLLYLDETSTWKINRGTFFKFNPKVEYMTVPQRSIYLLQRYGIKITQREYLSILLSDGVFDDNNKAYYHSGENGPNMSFTLPILIHHADHMSSIVERHQLEKEKKDDINDIKNAFKNL